MVIDLSLLGLVLFFGIIGAIRGFSKQLAHLIALVIAFIVARPIGDVLAPHFAKALNASEVIGVVSATFVTFILVLVLVRFVVTRLLKKILEGKVPDDQSLDTGLGFGFAAFKVLAVAYVVLSALTFVEQQISATGRRMGFTPRDSVSFDFARTYNLFTWVHFAPVRDFAQIGRALGKPQSASALKKDPAFKALGEDPRFRKALASREVKEAIATGDLQALLRSEAVVQLIQDEALAERLKEAAIAADVP